jgi:invasion protein IalB
MGRMGALVAAASVLGASAAFAQQAQPAQRPPAAQQRPAQQPAQQQPAQAAPAGPTIVNLQPDPGQAEWIKLCGKENPQAPETCFVTRDFVAENNTPVMALAVYETKGQPQRILRLLLPLTFQLVPGIRVGVDQGQPVPGRFTICFQNGCFAELQGNEAFINSMKRGTNLTVQARNQADREVSFVLPLAGFQKGFDGPALDPKVIEEERRKIEEQLRQRGEQMRQQQLQPGATLPAGQPAAPGAAPARP